jgi:hypothetical protein
MEKCFCGRFSLVLGKDYTPLYKGGNKNRTKEKRLGQTPSIGFCIELLLGGK